MSEQPQYPGALPTHGRFDYSPIAQKLAALIPEVLARPDVAQRLEDLQTLPRTPTLIGDDFVQLVRAQIDSWKAVAKASNVEVIG